MTVDSVMKEHVKRIEHLKSNHQGVDDVKSHVSEISDELPRMVQAELELLIDAVEDEAQQKIDDLKEKAEHAMEAAKKASDVFDAHVKDEHVAGKIEDYIQHLDAVWDELRAMKQITL